MCTGFISAVSFVLDLFIWVEKEIFYSLLHSQVAAMKSGALSSIWISHLCHGARALEPSSVVFQGMLAVS